MDKNNKLKQICYSFITIILLSGIILLFISFSCEANNTIGKICIKLLSTLGQTLIGSAIVSILFSFKDVRDFSLGLIKDLMLDFNFVNSFKSEQLKKMHMACHTALHYSDIKLNQKEWDLLSEKCVNVFRVPYCSSWKENIDCKTENNEIIKTFELQYELINPLRDSYAQADIEQRYNLFIPPNYKKEEYVSLQKMEILVDNKTFDIKPYIQFVESPLGKYNTLACIRTDEINLKQMQFKERLVVKLCLTTKVQIDDLSYTNRLRYPTFSFRLYFNCQDNKIISINPQFFGGFITKDGFEITVRKNYAIIECKDKLMLPGSGASVVLSINKSTGKRG